MAKVQNPEDNEAKIRKIEGKILEKLFTLSNQQAPLTSDDELRAFLPETTGSSNFDIAIENLIAGGFVSRIGNDEYQITMNGIDEHSRRNNEGMLF
ncbi:MAG: hypothetical protein M3Q77_04475 [Thermoproteota archaeon]|nr:hypothetical protein [Thermoproteota archaeon]